MTNDGSGAWALIAGSVLMALVFALHPAQHHPGAVVGVFSLSQIVHATALIAAPVIVYGLWEMAEWLGVRRSSVRAGLVFSLLAMLLTVNAAVVSNFVTPVAIEASRDDAIKSYGVSPAQVALAKHPPAHSAVGAAHRMPSPLGRLAVAFNRGFAQVHVALLSIGLIFFSLGLWGRSRPLGGLGVAVGSYPLVWQLSGSFSPETTTMPWIAFPQSAWLIAVAISMLGGIGRESAA